MTKKGELALRLKEFSFSVISLVRTLPKNEENIILGKQILRSSTSIGANYAEAVFGQSRQDFLHCLSICRKEANETLYWLEMIAYTNPNLKSINNILEENKELLKIFISSIKTIRLNSK